ncbi:MAG: ABC transporter permease [Bacteroidota bacterium]
MNQRQDIPAFFHKCFKWFCNPDLFEELHGDLEEAFLHNQQAFGDKFARKQYKREVLHLFRPSVIKRFPQIIPYQQTAMYQNFIKVAFRHLARQKFYSAINILGFAIGIACCLLISLFIKDELGYDTHLADGDRLFRVTAKFKTPDREGRSYFVTTPFAEAIETDYPEVEDAIRIAPFMYDAGSGMLKIKVDDENIIEEGIVYVDSSLLEMFGLPMVQGNISKALTTPRSVVITEEKAKQHFPEGEAMGKTLILNNNSQNPYQITGIIKDHPSSSHFQFSYLLSMETLEVSRIPNWGFSNYASYVKLKAGVDPLEFEEKMQGMIPKYIIEDMEAFEAAGRSMRFELQPVKDIHLYSADIVMPFAKLGNIQYVWLFGAIAVFILIIASINFMNMATARSANRAKEVGIRKVLGSVKGQLVSQFLVESILVSLIAFVVSLIFARLALPYFNEIAQKELSIPYGSWWFFPLILLSSILIGILSGIYPSLFLSSFKPIQVLKGKLSRGSSNARLRSALVILQFTISITLIVGTFIVRNQLNYIQNKQIGFNKEQVLILERAQVKTNVLKEKVLDLPMVNNATLSSYLPVNGYATNYTGAWLKGKRTEDTQVNMAKWYVDHDYVNTMGMEIIEGRDFDVSFPTDSQGIILNERGAEALGLEDPIGKEMSSYSYLDQETGELLYFSYTILGVVKDFHFKGMKEVIDPLSLVIGGGGALSIRFSTDDVSTLLEEVESIWKDLYPDQPFQYHFMDEQFGAMYAEEERVSKVFSIFSALAIIVACLGLFTLATFMSEQRSKEISIRKVLGATVQNIFLLLTRNFVQLILISLVIATPIAWFGMSTWLQDYEYRISIGWETFLLAGLLTLFVAIITISYQSIKAAIVNPVHMLRNE